MSMDSKNRQHGSFSVNPSSGELTDTLSTAIHSGYRFPEPEVIQLGVDISDELMLRHNRGSIHGNINPDTILLDSYGSWTLGDSAGAATDVSADIFALGQVLSDLMAHSALEPSSAFAAVIQKACAPDPKDRYRTAYAFFIALNKLAAATPMTGGHYTPNRNTSKDAAPDKPETNKPPQDEPETKVPPQDKPETQVPPDITVDTDSEPPEDSTKEDNITEKKGAKPKALWIILAVCAVVISIVASVLPFHSHLWMDATCGYPKYCAVCGKTKGDPLPHTTTKATCTEPGYCTACGAVVEAANGHLWQDDGNGSRYCIICGEPEGLSLLDTILEEAQAYAEAGQYRKAVQLLDNAWKDTGNQVYYDFAAEYRMQFGISNSSYIAAGKNNSVLIMDNGTLTVMGDNEFHELDARYWSGIVCVSAGDRHIVGLRSDGTVISAGSNDLGQRDVSSWTNVVAIAAGDVHTIALRADGTLLAAGQLWAPRCDVAALQRLAGNKRIVSIAAGYLHTLALLEDGTVIATGENGQYQCDVAGWTDIAAIYAGSEYSMGLKTDGTVVMTGPAGSQVSGWMNMNNLAAGDYFVVGVTEGGTLLSAGMESSIGPNTPYTVASWTGIVMVSAGTDHIITLTEKGKTRCAGKNDYSQINLDGFQITYPR